jgi:ferritin
MNKLVSDTLETALNERIKVEMDSAQIYFAMGTWCRYNGFNNVADFFFTHGNEELTHGKKVIDYLDDKNCYAQIPNVTRPETTGYSNIRALFEISFRHEQDVTKSYNDLATLALKETDHDVYRFAQSVLAEQVEELALYDNYLDKLDLLGDGAQAAYLFDESLNNIFWL